MASSGKKKTTMAKLDRERRQREKRFAKQARKDARKLAPAGPVEPDVILDGPAIQLDPVAEEPSAPGEPDEGQPET
jgi:hypothetical protein